jgi:23S rRNA (guanosine2251-2'-O)-methyltransferase
MGQMITGYHAVLESIIKGYKGTLFVSRKNERIDEILKSAGKNGIKVKRVDDRVLDKLPGSRDHRGCVFECSSSENGNRSESAGFRNIEEFIATAGESPSLVLVLDEITDPHNIGAILRSADCFGVSLVVLPERRSAAITETARKISSGAAAWVPALTVTNLSRTLEALKKNGWWIYGADMDGEDCRSLKPAEKSVLVMGSEGSGLHRLVREHCDGIVSIPLSGHVDSLNVSVAAGILLHEFSRRGQPTL